VVTVMVMPAVMHFVMVVPMVMHVVMMPMVVHVVVVVDVRVIPAPAPVPIVPVIPVPVPIVPVIPMNQTVRLCMMTMMVPHMFVNGLGCRLIVSFWSVCGLRLGKHRRHSEEGHQGRQR
jgi:hypothetical protein